MVHIFEWGQFFPSSSDRVDCANYCNRFLSKQYQIVIYQNKNRCYFGMMELKC